MITKKTLFILGAGASQPFFFPVGLQLRQNIINLIGPTYRNTSTPSYLQIFEQCGHSLPSLYLFSETLIKSQKYSIDAFLEHRPEYIKLGKLLITHDLIQLENLENIYKNSDWYGYLWNKMNSKFEDFDKNNVAFLTFNYDRSLETYLLNSMMALYNKPEEECHLKLQNIPIVHVHGKIGMDKYEDPINYTAYGQNIIRDYSKLIKAAETIKIIHEDISNDKEFILAHKLITDAEQIIILGLGYDETNLNRIKINDAHCSIIGSSFGLTNIEQESINKKFPGIKFSIYNHHKALEFLRHSVMIE